MAATDRPEGMPEEPQRFVMGRSQMMCERPDTPLIEERFVAASDYDALRRHAEALAVELVKAKDTIRKGDYDAIKELQRQVEMWKGFAKDAEADAGRYRFMRNQKESLFYLFPEEEVGRFGASVDLASFPFGAELDAAVDAAMRPAAEEKP